MQWTIEGKQYRQATEQEIKHLQSLDYAPHVFFGCKCGKAPWSAKNIALSNTGGYNGSRNIFYRGTEGIECNCPSSDLVCILPIYQK